MSEEEAPMVENTPPIGSARGGEGAGGGGAGGAGRIIINRPAFEKTQFDEEYGRTTPPKTTGTKEKITNCCRATVACCKPRNVLNGCLQLVPIVETLRTYKWKKDILMDMLAGISVGMVHLPQGMGFALLAAVAPVYGLYSSFWQIFLYMIFGGCRHLSIGTMAVISLIVGAVVEREVVVWKAARGGIEGILVNATATTPPALTYTLGNGSVGLFAFNTSLPNPADTFEGLTEEDYFRSSVATGVSLIAGITMFLMGVLRMGVLTTFMPSSFIGGFTTAAGFHITTTQLKFLFNIPVIRYGGIYNLPRSFIAICKALPLTSIPDLIISIITFSFLVFIKEFVNVKFRKRLKIPIPADMVVVVVATIVSFAASFHERWGVRTVGYIPPGVPGPKMPNLDRASAYYIDGMVAGVTSFAISISMVDILTKKHKYSYNPNNELMAYGLTYGLSSFLHCFVGAGAPPRCFVLELTGGKTQVANVFSSLLILLVLVAIAPVFRFLPNASLACIIIVALFPLFKQFKALPRIWKVSKPDFVIWIVTFIVSVVFDVSISLGVGILIAIVASVVPSLCAKGYTYSQIEHADIYAPAHKYQTKSNKSNVVVFRFDSTLYYLTVKKFLGDLKEATVDPMLMQPANESNDIDMKVFSINENGDDKDNTPKVHDSLLLDQADNTNIKAIVLDCSAISYIDLMGLNMLQQVREDYKAVGIGVVLANCHPWLMKKLHDASLISDQGEQKIELYPTVQDAMARLSQ